MQRSMLRPLAPSSLRPLTSLAHADEIQPMIFHPEAHGTRRTLDDGGELLIDRHLRILHLSADAADEMIVCIFRHLEVAEPAAEIEFAHAALRDQHAQVAIDRA